jgi:hypothetical protein
MTNTPKRFPVKFTLFATGREVAIVWFDFASEYLDRVEEIGARMAGEWGQEIDTLSGSVMPSGKVAEWERMGLRFHP